MDRYVKGLLTAYNRVLNLIETIDPDGKIIAFECLKARIEATLYGYKIFIKEEELAELEKSLIGTSTMNNDNATDEIVGIIQ